MKMVKQMKDVSLIVLKVFSLTFFFTIFINAQQKPAAPTPSPTPTTGRERITSPPVRQENSKPSAAQSNVEDDNEVISVNSKLVVVPASVIDSRGEPVKNLTKADFQLQEDGRRQEIAEISTAEQVPLEIVLLIDVSSSVNPLFEFEKDAAARFLQNVMRAEDRATVFLVGDQPRLIQQRDTAEQTASTVRAINPTKNYTAFFDTVLAAVDYLKKNSPQKSRRVILSLSDGEDTYSKNTQVAYEGAYKELDKKINTLTQEQRVEILNRYRVEALSRNYTRILRELQNADTVFYSVNPAGASMKINQISLRGQEGLQKFADETGGTAFLPKILPVASGNSPGSAENDKRNAETLESIFRQIAAELRAQYLLQFYSEANSKPGQYIRLKVDLQPQNNYRVRARQGYFAAGAPAQ